MNNTQFIFGNGRVLTVPNSQHFQTLQVAKQIAIDSDTYFYYHLID